MLMRMKPKSFHKASLGLRTGPATVPLRLLSTTKWDDKNLDHLFSANKNWSKSKKAIDPNFFSTNMKTHAPNILWIGCSDARVPANEVIGEPAGSVFVHRNIANQVVNTDVNIMSVIQYAVDYLKVRHIVVCGHYDCGGVKAALTNVDHSSPLENWLRNIRDCIRTHKDELDALPDAASVERRLIELNVIEQCLNLLKTGVVQRRRVASNNEMADGRFVQSCLPCPILLFSNFPSIAPPTVEL